MPNLLTRGATFLGTKLQQAGGRSVVYSRGARSVGITIVPLPLEELVEVSENVGVEVDQFDFQITASELVLSGVTELPKRGDVIRETLNGHEYEYKVNPPPGDKQSWEWLDEGTRLLLRVHMIKTKGP